MLKVFKVNFEQKKSSRKWFALCVIQNGSKLCTVIKSYLKPKPWRPYWVETQLLKREHFLDWKNTPGEQPL